ncbi:DUF2934 domain-containing protein [Bdellovibrio sp. SKB1291214]|uniref:DUF2934 domain-containing protein n=1 Tax=Bdellovibrio sp. SKB1291214 TaxID=1732569 RepID=UPI000B519B24|nr:DUF2934 domain-containing protein [Bdellovibrio sp. SKB1291214]UYL09628.1 DUF2934 domain-containing protein [Bdellovibrio sp. SKB1291214]
MPRLSSSEKLNKNNKSQPNPESFNSDSESKSAPTNTQTGKVSAEERERMIRETAFYLAEREGFSSDNNIYWLRAEEQIDKMLNG